MKLKFLVLATAILFSAITTHAQSDSTEKRQQIEALIKATKLEEASKSTAQQYVEAIIAQQPQLKGKRSQVEAFYNKYLGFDRMKVEMSKLYAKYYSADEIKDLVRFYQSSAGQKFNNNSIMIANELFGINNTVLQQHQKELMDLLGQK